MAGIEKLKIGDILPTNSSGEVVVLDKTDQIKNRHRLYKVKFLNTGNIKLYSSHRIREGKIKDEKGLTLLKWSYISRHRL